MELLDERTTIWPLRISETTAFAFDSNSGGLSH
jgi:hypothetical protein